MSIRTSSGNTARWLAWISYSLGRDVFQINVDYSLDS